MLEDTRKLAELYDLLNLGCGKIQIPAYKDEEQSIIKGTHEPLVSEELFEKVQDTLNGRRKRFAYTITAKDELPLRGFLSCTKCGRNLTGSASTGGSGIKHFYYHCKPGCSERIKAIQANDSFSESLKDYAFDKEADELYKEIVKDVFKGNSEGKVFNQNQIQTEIQKNRERINTAQQKMLDNEITADEYREAKKYYEPIIEKLLREHMVVNENDTEFKRYLKKGLCVAKTLDAIYDRAPINEKQIIIRSIIRKNMRFENNKTRTENKNELLCLITAFGGGYSANKKGADSQNLSQPTWVRPPGLEPGTLRL